MDSYKNGYNATLGGDGKCYSDYKKIAELYNKFQNLQETAKTYGCDIDTVHIALREYNITPKTFQEISREKQGKPIQMINPNTNTVIQEFKTMADGARYCMENKLTTDCKLHGVQSHIGQVANGKRKTAYGYIWKYI